jgi:hypothetical protein
MDPEKWRRLGQYIKARQFEAGACWPISWKPQSFTLKHAADRLYELYLDANNRYIERISEELDKNGRLIEGSRTLEGQQLLDHWDQQLISVYFLLMGYAIENLLKAILMVQHPEYFRSDQKMVDIRSHNLVDLCRRCNLELHQEEENLLNKLTAYVEWRGKYPVPLVSDKMWGEMGPDGNWETRGEAFRGCKQQQEIDRIYIKFLNELERIKPTEVAWKTPPPF